MSGAAGFTRFVLDLYSSPGVSRACLLLQERLAVDVNLVLFAAYVGVHRAGGLSPSDLDDVAASVRPWQDEVVTPLRRVRRRLVDGPAPAPDDATNVLRDRIKDVELEAEMIELERLGVRAGPLTDHGADAGPRGPRVTAAIGLVLGADAVSDDERAAVDVISSAAAELARRGTA